MQDNESDDYEETIMILELDGILDAESVRYAVRTGEIAIRKGQTAAPLVQVGSSIYTGEWMQTLGTDMIFCKLSNDEQTSTGCRGINEKSDECAGKDQPYDQNSSLKLLAVQDTRLISSKAIITRHSGNDAQDA